MLTNRNYEDFAPIAPKIKFLTHCTTRVGGTLFTSLLSLDSKVVVFFSRRQNDLCNSPNVSTTHVIMEGFCLAGVVTCLSPLWCSAIQVPEYTVDKTGHEANKTTQTTPGHVYMEGEYYLLPPPGM